MFNKKRLKAKIVKDNKLSMVHDDDLEKLLKSLGTYDDIKKGKKRCIFCDSVMTIDNIDSIVPHDGAVQFTCDKIKCHARLIGLR